MYRRLETERSVLDLTETKKRLLAEKNVRKKIIKQKRNNKNLFESSKTNKPLGGISGVSTILIWILSFFEFELMKWKKNWYKINKGVGSSFVSFGIRICLFFNFVEKIGKSFPSCSDWKMSKKKRKITGEVEKKKKKEIQKRKQETSKAKAKQKNHKFGSVCDLSILLVCCLWTCSLGLFSHRLVSLSLFSGLVLFGVVLLFSTWTNILILLSKVVSFSFWSWIDSFFEFNFSFNPFNCVSSLHKPIRKNKKK